MVVPRQTLFLETQVTYLINDSASNSSPDIPDTEPAGVDGADISVSWELSPSDAATAAVGVAEVTSSIPSTSLGSPESIT